MELDFDKLYKLPNGALKFGLIHPYIKKDKKWLLKALIIYGYYMVVFFMVLWNIFCIDFQGNDFEQTCKNGVLALVSFIFIAQLYVLIHYQDSIIEMIGMMQDDYKDAKELPAEERLFVEKQAKQSVFVCQQWLALSIGGTGSYVVKNLLTMAYYYHIGEFRLVPLYDLTYPAFIEDNKERFSYYLLTYACMLSYSLYASVMYTAYVPVPPLMMLHAVGQLDIVKSQIEKLFEEHDDEVIKKKITAIAKRIQHVNEFVGLINDVFCMAYELTLKGTTLFLPIAFYAIIEATKRKEISTELIVFIVGGTLISSSPCYYSELLMTKGEEVRQALYLCGWETYYDRSTRSSLGIMLTYALQPVAIQTIFKTLCLETLADLFQQSYTIFNLMNAMWE